MKIENMDDGNTISARAVIAAENEIPVFLSCDENYAPYLCAVMKSILDNTKSRVKFVVLASELSETARQNILLCGKNVDFVDVAQKLKEIISFKLKQSHISIAACYRYMISELGYSFEKAIYLDCDVVVLDDIKKLFDIELGDCYAAVADDFPKASYLKSFGAVRYFNSGVMLFNLKKMRVENIAEKLVSATVEFHDKLRYLDQDVLNMVFGANVIYLPPRFGLISGAFRKKLHSQYCVESDIDEAVENPAIVHFTGPDKPWKIPYGVLAHPWTCAYLHYLYSTPYGKEAARKISEFNSAKYFISYFKRHLFFFMRPQFFKMRILAAKNAKKYKSDILK